MPPRQNNTLQGDAYYHPYRLAFRPGLYGRSLLLLPGQDRVDSRKLLTITLLSIEFRLLNEERPARLLVATAILAGFIAAAAYILLAYVLSDVVSRVFLEKQTLDDVSPRLTLMLFLLLIRGCAIWGRELLVQKGATVVKSSLRRQLSSQLVSLGPLYTRAEHSGELVNTVVEGVESLDPFMVQYLPNKALAVIVPILVFLVVLLLDPWTTFVFLVAAPLMLLILALIGGRARSITERRFLEMSWMSAFFLDILQGLPTLKLFDRDREQAQNIRADQRRLWQHNHGSAAYRFPKFFGNGMGNHGRDGHGGPGDQSAPHERGAALHHRLDCSLTDPRIFSTHAPIRLELSCRRGRQGSGRPYL